MDNNAKARYDSMFQYYSSLAGLDWTLVKAQAIAESELDPDAVSPVGAKGLAQFMNGSWTSFAPTVSPDPYVGHTSPHVANVYNPEDAIRAQTLYMKRLKATFGDDNKALAAYNWGMGNLRQAINQANETSADWMTLCPPETQAYVGSVKAMWIELNKGGSTT